MGRSTAQKRSNYVYRNHRSRGSSVSTVTRLQLGHRGSNFDSGSKSYSSPKRPHRPWGPPSLLFSGSRRSVQGGKTVSHLHLVVRLRLSGAIRLLPYMSPLNVLSGTKVKNEWSFTSTSLLCFRGLDRDKFTLFFCRNSFRKQCRS